MHAPSPSALTARIRSMLPPRRPLRPAILCLILLGVFALYAGAARLMPLYDDAVLMPAINNRSLLTIFENRPYGDGHHRPMSYVPWLLTRDLFGWFTPAILHLWNVYAHVLNTALVAALAWRLGRGWKRRGWISALAGLMFGLAPLSYEAVIWASALVHPLMTLFGLASLHAYFTARTAARRSAGYLLVSALFLLAACLSHEMGFIFGLAILALEGFLAVAQRRVYWGGLILGGLGLGYAVYYRLFLVTKWTAASSDAALVGWQDGLKNLAYQVQALLSGMVIILRPWVARPEENAATVILLAAGAALAGAGCVLLKRARLLQAGLAGAILWLVLIVPSSLLLSSGYVLVSPRMTYAPAVGAALISAALVTALWDLARHPAFRGLMVAVAAVVMARSALYVTVWMNETARLTPALNVIDADLRQSDPSERLLLINPSFIVLLNDPWFLLGREAMPIWQYPYDDRSTPMWAWPASVSGIRRDTVNDRHDISLAHRETNFSAPGVSFARGDRFSYGVSGEYSDDGKLRADILASNYIYRFEYGPGGLRGRRLAVIKPLNPSPQPLARLSNGPISVTIDSARATRCGTSIELQMTWSLPAAVNRPAAVFVHGLDEHGQQVVVADRDLLEGYLPLDVVPARLTITETREVELPESAAPVTQLVVGVYNRDDVKRYAAIRADGRPWDGDQVSIPITDDWQNCQAY